LVADGEVLLGVPLGWRSISLTPYESVATMLAMLPPVAMFLSILWAGGKNGSWLAAAMIVATIAGILLGLLQVSSANPPQSPWYLYKVSNFGFATGFFANSNHMASLLLVTLPFVAALGVSAGEATKDRRKRFSLLALSVGMIAVLIVGLALNGSLAGAGLLLPVGLATLMMSLSLGKRLKLLAVGAGILAGILFIALLFTPLAEKMALAGASTSISTRKEMLGRSIEAAREFGPVGSGLGSFAKVYPLFENPDSIDQTWVNHAHNDYLEIAVEWGLPGIALVAIFLLWWLSAIWSMARAPNASLYAKAGAIGSAAILLHSLVDFPLRTSAISSLFALCLALLLSSRRTPTTGKDLREARHLVIE
jgi:O-antigen ligase